MHFDLYESLDEFEDSLRLLVCKFKSSEYYMRQDIADLLREASSMDNAGISSAISNYLTCRDLIDDFENITFMRATK
jgi:hypothetical protein